MSTSKSTRKVNIILIVLILLLLVIIFALLTINNVNKVVISNESISKNNIINSNTLTMMYETEADSGEYQVSSDTTWPQEGYIFNAELSSCENGSKITWDDENKRVVMQANTSDKCYVYFDAIDYAKLMLDKLKLQINTNTINPSSIAPRVLSYKDVISSETYTLTPRGTTEYYYSNSYNMLSTGRYSLDNYNTDTFANIYKNLTGKYIVLSYYTPTRVREVYKVINSTYDAASNKGVITYQMISSTPDEFDTSENGLYVTKDDFGTTYYFRGNVANNYVYFAGFYWRIVRINGDGTLRLIYDGTNVHDNGVANADRAIGKSTFNNTSTEYRSAGYMIGEEGSVGNEAYENIYNSTIKTFIDEWYKNNIVDNNYDKYVADTIYCNDRSINGDKFSSYNRLRTSTGLPSLLCANSNDRFTVYNDKKIETNGMLTYPVGLISADEAEFAGLVGCSENNFLNYLSIDSDFLTMTPCGYNLSEPKVASRFSGGCSSANEKPGQSYYVRPVLSLKKDLNFSGNGLKETPFIIVD